MTIDDILTIAGDTMTGLFYGAAAIVCAGLVLFTICVLFRLPRRVMMIATAIVFWAIAMTCALGIIFPPNEWANAPWWFYVALLVIGAVSLLAFLNMTPSFGTSNSTAERNCEP